MRFIKIMLREIYSYRYKFFLVFISILVTILSLFVYNSFDKSVYNTRINQLREETLNSQISIRSEIDELGLFDEEDVVNEISKQNKNITHIVQRCCTNVNCNLKIEELYLYGVDIEEQTNAYHFDVLEGKLNYKEKNGVIVSEKFVEDNNLKLNDEIEMNNIKNGDNKLVVKTIVKNCRFFDYDNCTVVCKKEVVQQILNREREINRLDITINDMENINKTVDDLNNIVKSYGLKAEAKFENSFYDTYVTTIELALKLFLMFNIIISIYIIYSTFQTYVYQNAKQMAIYRSIGFSVKDYKKLVVGEMTFIVIIALLCGVLLLHPCLKIMLKIFLNDNCDIYYEKNKIFISSVLIYLISLISVLMAIKKVISLPITELIRKNEIVLVNRKKWLKITCITVLIAFLMFIIIKKPMGVISYYLFAIVTVILFISVYSIFTKYFARMTSKTLDFFGKEVGIAGKQCEKQINDFLQSMVIISIIVMIFTLTTSISQGIKDSLSTVYNGADIQVKGDINDVGIYKKVFENESSIENYTIQKRRVSCISDIQVELSGIDVDEYALQDYEQVIDGQKNEIFKKLKEKNTIVVSSTILNNLDKHVGDEILVDNTKLLIVGQVSTFENMGKVIFMSNNNFDKLYEKCNYFMALITISKNNDVNNSFLNICEKLDSTLNNNICKLEDAFKENNEGNQLIINMIYLLCVLTFIIAIIGLSNNLTINMVSRVRTFIIYRTIGISKKQLYIIEMVNFVAIVLFSCISGIVLGCILMPIIRDILSYYVGSIIIKTNIFNTIIFCLGMSLIIMLIITLAVRKYVMKDSYMEDIQKYY